MTAYGDDIRPRPERYTLDAARFWASSLATAVVAALVAIVGVLVARGLFDVPIMAPRGDGVWGDASTITYAAGAAVAAMTSTAATIAAIKITRQAGTNSAKNAISSPSPSDE